MTDSLNRDEWVAVDKVYWARCICQDVGVPVGGDVCRMCGGIGKVYAAYGKDGKLIEVQHG